MTAKLMKLILPVLVIYFVSIIPVLIAELEHMLTNGDKILLASDLHMLQNHAMHFALDCGIQTMKKELHF